VIARFSARCWALVFHVGVPFVGLVTLAGCTDEYPANLTYPLRNDPLLISSIISVPRHWDKPGDFPARMLSGLSETDREDADKRFLDPSELSGNSDDQLETALENVFGTPQEPKVGAIAGEIRASLKLDDTTLARGSVLYRMHCLHCHGLTGNGRGPTASWVNPHPRDYRQGVFKFTSTLGDNARKPRREDLLRTVRQGIEGTSMPSFGLIPEADQEAIVSYVIHLSMRGNVEFILMQGLLEQRLAAGDIKDEVNQTTLTVGDWWLAAGKEENLIKPDPKFPIPSGDEERRESITRGYNLFRAAGDAGCIACHKDYGRQAALFFDAWGTIGRPTDLTQGVYRGGRRRIDLYWRLYQGVNGSNMPPFGNVLASESFKAQNKHDGIWDLINFLEVLPYKTMREKYGVHID
jgi:mono/diheme cytochrome c family protein